MNIWREKLLPLKYKNIAPRVSFWIMWRVKFRREIFAVNLKLLLARFTFLRYIFRILSLSRLKFFFPRFFHFCVMHKLWDENDLITQHHDKVPFQIFHIIHPTRIPRWRRVIHLGSKRHSRCGNVNLWQEGTNKLVTSAKHTFARVEKLLLAVYYSPAYESHD